MKLRAPFDQPKTLRQLRPLYETQRAVVLPGACEPKPPEAVFKPFFLAHRTRIERGLEVICDLSTSAAGPQCFYGPLVIPQLPGLLAVVERTPAIFRRDRYLTQSAEPIVRLRAAFAI
jgi:hypothetical protein